MIRILVVEDEGIVATDIQDRLVAIGYQVVGYAVSAAEAVAAVEAQRPDLVLMDIRLQGGVDGIQAAEEIGSRFRVPVVFLTAYAEEATLARAKHAKPFGYILKPFNDRELKSAIEIALYKHQAEAEIRRLSRLLDVLGQVNQVIVRLPSREELLPAICRLAVERGRLERVWISWRNPETTRMETLASFDSPISGWVPEDSCAMESVLAQGGPVRAVREGRPSICDTCGSDVDRQACTLARMRPGEHSCGSFPLWFQGQVAGALSLCVAESGFFREREIGLLKEMAMDISYALDKIAAEAQRKRLSEQFRHQSRFLQTLMDAMPYPIFYKDAQYRYLGCNRAFEQFFGIRRDDLLGKTVQDIWPRDLADFYQRSDRDLLDGDRATQMVSGEVEAAGGQRVDVLFHKAVFHSQDGAWRGIIGTVEDLTERKQAAAERAQVEAQLRQAQKMEALGTLAGGIAHDFNNILGIILGNVELARWETDEDSTVGQCLQQVFDAARRATDLVQQILTFSRRHEVAKAPMKVAVVVEDALKMIRASLPSTIAIKRDLNSDAVVLGDSTQMHQVLMNLCTNAAQAMAERGGELSVSLGDVTFDQRIIPPCPTLAPGSYVRLSVRDTGPGIDPAMMDRIFDPFFTSKAQMGGTGLGLAVVHGIVKSHGGAITVDSLAGAGSTFRVFLPVFEKDFEPQAAVSEKLPRGRERILIVDDEPALAMVAKQMLEYLGYDVHSQTSSVEALKMFQRHLSENPFDLVITDMTMPQLTGVDLAERLHELRPDLPIVICTGYNDKDYGRKVEVPGIQGFLMKPFIMQQLAETVRRVLDDSVT